MKQIIIILLLLAACTSTAEEPIKFGAVLPLTGTNAFYGDFSRPGLELAIEDLNAQGGINGKKVVMIYEDSAGDKAKAVTATQKLINIDGVDALFTITTSMGGAVAPVAEENKVPLMYGSAANSFAEGKTYVFKDYPDASDECELLMKTAQQHGHKKIAMFGMNLEFTKLCQEGAEKAGKLEIVEFYEPGETDFKTHFTKIKSTESTALILLTVTADCKNAYKAIRELGLKTQLYLPFQAFGCGTEENTKENPEILHNAFGAEVTIDETNPAYAKFNKRLEERKWTTQRLGSAIMYDGVMQMAQAYKDCKDKFCATEKLRKLNYNGVSGKVSYGGDQIVEREFALVKYENGKWVKV